MPNLEEVEKILKLLHIEYEIKDFSTNCVMLIITHNGEWFKFYKDGKYSIYQD